MQFSGTNISPIFAPDLAILPCCYGHISFSTATNHGNVSNIVINKYNQVFKVTISFSPDQSHH